MRCVRRGKAPGSSMSTRVRSTCSARSRTSTHDGELIEKNAALAFQWYRRGAEGGDFRARFSYAGMLAAQGRRAEALHWLAKVSERINERTGTTKCRPSVLDWSTLFRRLTTQSPSPAIKRARGIGSETERERLCCGAAAWISSRRTRKVRQD